MRKLYGNAVVGQSGGPTAAINATLAGVIRGVMEQGQNSGAIGKLYGMRNGIEGLLQERLTDLGIFAEDEQKLCALELTPAAALGSCRKKLPKFEDDRAFYEQLLTVFKKYDIRYFFYIGGNDSMDTVSKLSAAMAQMEYDMRIMGVPKTIDNDLEGTDHTPGFGSAAKYVATTVSEIIRDAAVYTTKAVTIVEIMGRDAGWLTTSAALGRLANGEEPDLVYLPEKPFCMDEFIESTKKALEKHPNVVVAVSEGIRFADGTYVGAGAQSGVKDVFGHQYLAGTGKALEYAVRDRIGCKVRSVELNVSQRCAAHLVSATDIAESVAIGRAAALAAEQGESGKMMLYKRVSDVPYAYEIDCADVHEIANKIKRVPDAYINADHNGITNECLAYLRPLIEGERYPKYVNGLPEQIIL
ncbi:MAG: 6-phosphofructokinase [Clostridia bacterium]|nr:6-phosphofructokinase [Clostridia bacterium]